MRLPLALALTALRQERRLVPFLLAAVTLTAALVFPTETLPRLGLQLHPIPSAAGALALTEAATGPSDAQHGALVELLQLLRALGWTAVGVAGLTILALYAISSAERSHELGVHRAVGASRRAILATLLLEAAIVSGAALLLGILAGQAALSFGLGDWPGTLARSHAWPLAIAATLVALVVVGRLLPIHVAARRDVPLEDRRPVSLGVPIVQFGVSLALLVAGAALFRASDAGVDADVGSGAGGVLVGIDASALDTPARARLFASLLDASRGGGVAQPSLASAGQPIGLGTVDFLTTHCGMCYRSGIFLEYEGTRAVHHLVSPDSFAANNIPVVGGRVFAAGDTLGAERVAVINRQMALRHFQPGDPVGRHLFLSTGFPSTPYTVVGVVDDGTTGTFGAAHQPREHVYLSVLQQPPLRAGLLLPGRHDAVLERLGALASSAGARTGPVLDASAYRAGAVAPTRWLARWAVLAGTVLVLLSAAGLAAAVRSWVASLRAELGLRRAVGARRRAVLWFVGSRAVLAGVAGIGVSLVVLGTVVYPVFDTSLRGVPLWRPGVLFGFGAALVLVALASALAPARRIAHMPPARLFE